MIDSFSDMMEEIICYCEKNNIDFNEIKYFDTAFTLHFGFTHLDKKWCIKLHQYVLCQNIIRYFTLYKMQFQDIVEVYKTNELTKEIIAKNIDNIFVEGLLDSNQISDETKTYIRIFL